MVNDKITLNFEIEKGEPIDRYYFSARIKLTDESKNFLREKLGSTIQFDNLDDHFNLNHENFYIYYNKYSEHNGRSELYVRDDNGRYLTSNLPLNHYGFSMELSSDGASIADYGFYPLYAIYNPNHYDKAKEKVFDDHGELSPIASNVLDNFLSNTNSLTTQEMFLQLQNKATEKEEKLIREKRQAEEELDQKNEELKEFIEKGEITLFKVVKGNDVGNGRSAVVLQFTAEGKGTNEITLDSEKFYIADYEDSEFLHCVSSDYDMLLDYENLFFVLNKSFYSDFESGFYSADSTDPYNYAKYSKEPYLSGDQLSEKLSNELEEDSNQIGTEFTIDDEQIDEEVVVGNEIKSRKKRVVDEDSKKNVIEDVNKADENGATLLHSAASLGDLSKIVTLIEHNAYIDARDHNGQTPLHYAIQSGNTEVAKYLIDNGANLNIQDNYYQKTNTQYVYYKTPLHYAVESGDTEIAKYLVDHGANPNIQDAYSRTPLQSAIYSDNTEIVEYLLDHNADPNSKGYTPLLFTAVKLGHTEIVKNLVEHGADLNVKNTSAQTLLHYAIELKHTEIAKYLIDHNVDINTRDISSGKPPLHFAMSIKNTEVANYLIEHGADVNVKDSYGLAPLHFAVNLGNQEILEYLIKNNANIDVRDSEGWTPLIHAVRHGQLDKVKYLIKNGADVDIHGNEGWTLFEHAEQWIDDRRILKDVINSDRKYADAASWEKTGKDMLDYLKGVTKNTIQEEESNYIDQMQADDSSSYVEDQPALQSNRDGYADMEKALQEKLHGDEIRKQSNEKAQKDMETRKVTVETESSNNKIEKQAKPIEDEQETVMASVIENMDKNSDIEAEISNSVANSQYPLKIRTGSPLEVGKYKVELQVTYDDIKNFYDTVRGKYHDGSGYNREQVMVLYNGIVRPAHNHHYELFTLDEAHVANDHLFIKGQDFGTLHDFNEMFYKSDELI
ncbi:ankyrin repeat domain-containing protein [Wolbachia endosymbiont of Rhagoletis indifferens]|uniref:ankyrin repeat domain-containing protein n=1 Tax=Wolbachia endosymbiont of Rhagoletis indifferens TaxID=3383250 RepID=UPI003AF36A53